MNSLRGHERTLVNVLGASYSGTTMLDLMLGNCDNGFSCGEAYSWFRPWRTHHFKINCPCGASPCPVWDELKNVRESDFHAQVLSRLNLEFVIDSAKDLNWFVDASEWAYSHKLDVRNVVIWKEPIDLAYSFWKRTGSLTKWRRHFLTYYGRIMSLGVPFVAVKYNKLTADPGGTLRQICDSIGMAYFPGKERFWEKKHHFLYGSLGTRQQCQSGVSEIRDSIDMDPEFMQQVPDLRAKFSTQRNVGSVVERLEENDVGKAGDGRRLEWEYRPTDRRPVWYVAGVAKAYFRRLIPERAPPFYR